MVKCKSLIIITMALIMFACMHKAEAPPDCVAGPGGSVTIVVYANHGGTSIPNYFTHFDTAFLKFGTIISPGTKPADYDTYYVGSPREDHIHCAGLKCGDYFIYRTAWDSIAHVSRYGGYGISITQKTGDTIINVAVN